MQKNNILILDDEALACSYLKECIDSYIKDSVSFSNFTVHTVSKLSEFWIKIKELQPSIIFLDIEMPVKNGIEVAQELKENIKKYEYSKEPIIVFCTAYDNYAYKAFTLNAVDYLLKPADDDKIKGVFDKILIQYKSYLEDIYKYVYVSTSGVDIKIPLKEIIYFKADMKYISVVTAKKEFLLNETLLNLEEKYEEFVKIHRAYLINPIYIQKFYKKNGHWFASLKNYPITLPVSRRQRQDLELKINYKIFFDESE